MASFRFRVGVLFAVLIGTCIAQVPDTVRTVCVEPSTRVIKRVLPKFPPGFKPRAHFNGTVLLEFKVDKTGVPQRIHVRKGDPDLAAVAVEAIRQWRWEPLKLNGKAVGFDTSVTVIFEPR